VRCSFLLFASILLLLIYLLLLLFFSECCVEVVGDANPLLRENWLTDAPLALRIGGAARVEASENVMYALRASAITLEGRAAALLVENSMALAIGGSVCVAVRGLASAQLEHNALFGGGVVASDEATLRESGGVEFARLPLLTSKGGCGAERYRVAVAAQVVAARGARRRRERRSRAIVAGSIAVAGAAGLAAIGALAWALTRHDPSTSRGSDAGVKEKKSTWARD
jgi:hypothetical protein